jgi:molybdenum cofactor cytidylyltransferase
MIAPDRVGAVLLAAGRSTRFGNADKLASDYQGEPLVSYAARAILGVGFGAQLAVVGAGTLLRLPGYTLIENPSPQSGIASSIICGLTAIEAYGLDAMLICLGDMPAIDSADLRALCEA